MSRPHDTAADLRAALARVADVAGDGTACPAPDRLVASARGELARPADEEVILHIAACTACAASWRIAREVKGETAHSNVAAPNWTRWAAAAVIVAAIGGGIFYFSPVRETIPVYREQGEETIDSLVSESEPLPRDAFVLRWAAVDEGALYDVVVADERMRTLSRAVGLTEGRYQVPTGDLAEIESGARTYWQIIAQLPDGTRIESSTFIARLR